MVGPGRGAGGLGEEGPGASGSAEEQGGILLEDKWQVAGSLRWPWSCRLLLVLRDSCLMGHNSPCKATADRLPEGAGSRSDAFPAQ